MEEILKKVEQETLKYLDTLNSLARQLPAGISLNFPDVLEQQEFSTGKITFVLKEVGFSKVPGASRVVTQYDVNSRSFITEREFW